MALFGIDYEWHLPSCAGSGGSQGGKQNMKERNELACSGLHYVLGVGLALGLFPTAGKIRAAPAPSCPHSVPANCWENSPEPHAKIRNCQHPCIMSFAIEGVFLLFFFTIVWLNIFLEKKMCKDVGPRFYLTVGGYGQCVCALPPFQTHESLVQSHHLSFSFAEGLKPTRSTLRYVALSSNYL